MSDDFKQLVSDAEKLLRKYAQHKSSDLERLRATLEDAVEEYKEVIADRATAASDQVQEWSASSFKYARANPWTVAAAAVGVLAIVYFASSLLGDSDSEEA